TSDLYFWRNYANTTSRSALRRANVVKASWVHADRRSHAGARHRREHSDLQCGQRCVAQTVALSRIRQAGVDERIQPADAGGGGLAELCGLAPAAICLREVRRV